MAYSFIQQCIRDGSLDRWFSFRRWNKTYSDLSGNGYNLTTTSNLWFGGGGIQFARDNGYASGVSTGLTGRTSQSIVILGEFQQIERIAASPSYALALEDAGDIGWRVGFDDTPRIFFEDNAVAATRTLAFNYTANRVIGITMTNGGTPIGYADGYSEGNFSGTVTIGGESPANVLYVGNRRAADRSMYNPIQDVLLFNDVLTAAENLTLSRELMRMPGGDH